MSKLTGIIFRTPVFSNALYDYLFSAERLHCPDCNKTFKSKTSLENHKSVHKPSSHYQVKNSNKLVFFSLTPLSVSFVSHVLPESWGIIGAPSRLRPFQRSLLHIWQRTRGTFSYLLLNIHLVLKVPVEQETLTLSFMEEEEEERAPGAFQVWLVVRTFF